MANDRDKSGDGRGPVDRSDPNYKVGYKRPPRGRPFLPGQSGNLKGKRKGQKNLATLIDEELAVQVAITEHGKRKTISKSHAVAKQLVNKAAGGDTKSIATLLARELARSASADAGAPTEFKVTEADTLVLKAALERVSSAEEPHAGSPAGLAEEGREGKSENEQS